MLTPTTIKTLGYLISTVSVALLGAVAWPGAARAGLTLALILGMAASVLGMAFRWYSYRLEKQQQDDQRAGGSRWRERPELTSRM